MPRDPNDDIFADGNDDDGEAVEDAEGAVEDDGGNTEGAVDPVLAAAGILHARLLLEWATEGCTAIRIADLDGSQALVIVAAGSSAEALAGALADADIPYTVCDAEAVGNDVCLDALHSVGLDDAAEGAIEDDGEAVEDDATPTDPEGDPDGEAVEDEAVEDDGLGPDEFADES